MRVTDKIGYFRIIKNAPALRGPIMKTVINACNSHPFSEYNCPETAGIWEDAGFTPPQIYIRLTEYLHFIFVNEGEISECLLKDVTGIINKPEWQSGGSFAIFDNEKMCSYAKSMGIVISKKDESQIAADITAGIIGEYMPACDIFHDLTKTIIPDKNEIIKEYSSLKA